MIMYNKIFCILIISIIVKPAEFSIREIFQWSLYGSMLVVVHFLSFHVSFIVSSGFSIVLKFYSIEKLEYRVLLMRSGNSVTRQVFVAKLRNFVIIPLLYEESAPSFKRKVWTILILSHFLKQ